MSKVYYLTFGTTGDPRTFAGLAPTFLVFNNNGTAVTPPSISAVSGATGFYSFTWGTTTPICFMADAATTSPGTVGRYVVGSIDPADRADEYGSTLTAIGLTALGFGFTNYGYGVSIYAGQSAITIMGQTLIGIGNTIGAIGVTSSALGALLGDNSSSFGSTSVDPTTVFGHLKRAQEFREGNQVYTKSTGLFDIYSRGSSYLLREKTVSDTSTQTTKT